MTTTLPTVISCDKGLNTPRSANMRLLMKSRSKKIAVWGAGDLGLDPASVGAAGALVVEGRYQPPAARPEGRRIDEGSPEATVKALVRLLRDEAKVI